MLALDGVLLPDEGTDVTDHRLLSTLSIRLYVYMYTQTNTNSHDISNCRKTE